MIPHSRPSTGRGEVEAAARVLKTGLLAQGKEVSGFEKEAAAFTGLKGAVAVTSGTKALEFALKGLKAGPGDEVLIPSFVCSSLWHAVRLSGAEPVLVDCEPDTCNPSMRDAAGKLTGKTKAVILPHIFGVPSDIKGALALGIPVIEDCAQAIGASCSGRPLGSFGKACVLSFYATKLLTTGEGGMILSSASGFLDTVRDMREYDNKIPDRPRENAKMTDLQAAVGRVQLCRLKEFLRIRKSTAARYDRAFEGLAARLPAAVEGRVYYRYVLQVGRGKLGEILKSLNRMGVAARRPVFRPLHLDVARRGSFAGAQRAWETCVSLPLYPSLKESEIKTVINSVRRALK